jgi:hypothetical protein
VALTQQVEQQTSLRLTALGTKQPEVSTQQVLWAHQEEVCNTCSWTAPTPVLQVYLSSLGFARFTNVRYSREIAELDNQFVHLTNVAVQKEGGSAYNSNHGNKWPLQDLRLHLEATRGHEATAQLFAHIQELVVHTLQAVKPVRAGGGGG